MKGKLLHHLRTYDDRGVFANRSRNVLANAPKTMSMTDFVAILQGAGVVDLEFMVFGMKLRQVDAAENNAICGAVVEQWKKLK